jgi:hypothetical protein
VGVERAEERETRRRQHRPRRNHDGQEAVDEWRVCCRQRDAGLRRLSTTSTALPQDATALLSMPTTTTTTTTTTGVLQKIFDHRMERRDDAGRWPGGERGRRRPHRHRHFGEGADNTTCLSCCRQQQDCLFNSLRLPRALLRLIGIHCHWSGVCYRREWSM